MSDLSQKSISQVRDGDLSRYRYHTGAQPTRIASDEVCPPLFRDIGVDAMARFLRGGLRRLCGPTSPITYLRTAEYCEPYTDYGRIGRIMLLRPKSVMPWHSGLHYIYIAPRETTVDAETMVFLPADVPLDAAAERLGKIQSRQELVDAFGPQDYEDVIAGTLERLDHLQRTYANSERSAAPLRRQYQSIRQRERDRARAWMQRADLIESDLCTAWHHLSEDRRQFIQSALLELPQGRPC